MDATLVQQRASSAGRSRSLTPEPHLILLIEGARPGAMSVRYRLSGLTEIVIGRGKERAAKFLGTHLAIEVPDPWMSSVHVRIQPSGTGFTFADANSTNGSMINGSAVKSADLRDGDILELGQTFFLFRAALPSAADGPDVVDAAKLEAPRGLLSLLPSLSQKFELLSRVVEGNGPIVISGPSGTGKEVAAKTIHELSQRSGDFIPVNCGGLPDNLMESEFFGYKKGAFSGATHDHPGLVLAANNGTLFLDEIGDLPMASQAVLLRVLQEREVRPVGATKPVPVDFRLLCATHRDMESLIEEGRFRNDLYGRLSGFHLKLPALRDRLEDLGILIATLLRDVGGPMVTAAFSNEALRALIAYPWPRNVRELRACLQTALDLAIDDRLELDFFPDAVRDVLDDEGRPKRAAAVMPDADRPTRSLGLNKEQRERREELVALLREYQGNISAVARAMGKARSQVQRWMKRYELDADAFKTDET